MNIARIIYDWPAPWGGLAPNPFEITRFQLKKGYKIDVFCGAWPKSGGPANLPGLLIHSYMRELLPGTINFTSSVILFFSFLKWFKSNSVDVIHSHGHFAIWLYLYRGFLKRFNKKARLARVPFVVHFHNTVAGRAELLIKNGQTPTFISKNIAWPLAKLSDKWACKYADALIFCGKDILEQALRHYNADPKKCFLIENGVNTDLFSNVSLVEKDKTRKDLGLDSDDKVILYVGKVVRRKNVDVLYKVLSLLDISFKLLIVGEFSDKDFAEELHLLEQDLKLSGRIIKAGYTEYPNIHVAYQASDILLLPSSFEGLPKVVLESLACGVPFLASGFTLQNNISGAFFITDNSPQAIASKIVEIVNSNIYVDKLDLKQKYSWEIKVNQIDDVYKKIISNLLGAR